MSNTSGYTIWYYYYDTGKPMVYARCNTEDEKNRKLKEASDILDEEELSTISVEPDYNFHLPY